jgi:RND family efflux transporter MFP subunit
MIKRIQIPSIPKPALLFAGLIALGIAAGAVSWLAPRSAPTAPAPGAGGPAVTVAAPLVRSVTDWAEYTGQFVAVDRVEIRARVGGYLTEIRFTDGQRVERGEPLFQIDPRPYEIALAQARAKLDQAAGTKDFAGRQLVRAGELRRNDFVAASVLDQRTEESRGASATVEAARAAMRDAELNLQFTRITAPVSGRISARAVSIGNLISGGPTVSQPTLLTTIVSLDPIQFLFDLSEADFLAQARRDAQPPLIGQSVRLRLIDETGWPHEGRIDFIDNQFDRASGTIRVRAVLANPDRLLVPGGFGRVRLSVAAPHDAMLVPDAAIVTDQTRRMVMIVKDGVVQPRVVTLGPVQEDGLRVVVSGLAPDDMVVVNGLMRARPGAMVTPQPGTIP